LAGTQEATRQFDGLKSSLKNFTRASLWSGLIVYAQPVSDGKLPSPQIYYLMPPPQQRQQPSGAPAAQQQPVLAHNGATSAPKPEAVNNHGAEAAATAASNPDAAMLAAMRADEDAANSELVLDKLPMNSIASHFAPPPPPARQPAPPQPDRVRLYEEVAKNAPLAARKFKHDADLIERVHVKELDAAKLVAETERLAAEHGHLERLKSLGEAENLRRRMDIRVVRRTARTERHDRLKVLHRPLATRGVALPEMSSIGCEKMITRPEVAPAPHAAPLVATKGAQMRVEPDVELGLPAASNATGNSWTLNCDTEPEQK
jgi:hypothetical protein